MARITVWLGLLWGFQALAAAPDPIVPLEAMARGRKSWPTERWSMGLSGMASDACREFKKALVEEGQAPAERGSDSRKPEDEPLMTDGLVVVQNGAIRYEWYDGFYKESTPHCLWSASKSVTAALVAAAVQEGKLSLRDRLETFYPVSERGTHGPHDHHYTALQISDLVFMGAGFEWNESYEGDPKQSSITQMLYFKRGFKDTAHFALTKPMTPEGPLGRWTYSSGNSSLLLGALKRIYGNAYNRLPWARLFDPIGAKSAVVEQDGAGVFVGSSYVNLSVRDLAKFGFLYLNGGLWGKKLTRLLDPEMVRMAMTVSPAIEAPGTPVEYIKEEGVYGGGFWLNRPLPTKGLPRPFPDAPEDLFFAAGHYGQMVLIFPSHDLIVARTAHDREYWSKLNRIAKLAVGCFGGKKQ